MAAAIADVAERARGEKLEPDEVHGGTFTITNPGQFGAVLATPIINQPQVAILDLEAIVKRPVVVGGRRRSIAIRPMTYLPMSWDHRALDGATAARFLGADQGAARGLGGRADGRRQLSATARPSTRPCAQPVLFEHEEVVVRRGERSGVHGDRRPLDGAGAGPGRGADLGLPDARATASATRCAWRRG